MNEVYHILELPSKGRVYGGISEIEIRTYKGKDEKLLSELSYDNFEKRIEKVLGSVIKGIDPKELTLGDRLFILLWERINSYDAKYRVQRTCEFCGGEMEEEIDLSSIELQNLPDNFEEPYAITLSDQSTLKLRLLRVKDEIQATSYEKAGKGSLLTRMALSIVDDNNFVERERFLEELPAKDISKIRAFHEKFNHGPIMRTELTCKLCDQEGTAVIPFRRDLIYPDAETIREYFGEGI